MTNTKIVSYVCPEAPGFQFRLGKQRVRFRNSVLELTDPEMVKQLDKLIVTLPTFKRLVKKVDKEAALKLMEAHKNSTGGALKGGVTGQGLLDAQKIPMAGDAALKDLSVEQQEELIDAVQEDSGLNLTKQPEAPKQSQLKEAKLAKPLNISPVKATD